MRLLQLLGFLLTSSLIGGNIDSTNSIANNYFEKEEYSRAALEFERMIYFSKNSDKVNKLLLQKSYCRKLENNYEGALNALNRIDLAIATDSFRDTIYYERALNFYLNKDFRNAEMSLLNIDQSKINYTTYLYILTLNENDNWEKASELYNQLIYYHGLNLKENDFYLFLKDKKRPHDNLPKILSFIIPGLGQLSLGKPKDAVFSLGLTSLSGLFTADSFLNGYYFSGILTAMPLFVRFYFGGIQNVNRILDQKRLKSKIQTNNELKNKIIHLNSTIYY